MERITYTAPLGAAAVTYAARSGAVRVKLGGGADDGAAGEGDAITGFQAVTGGSGADELVGSAADDVLDGGAVADTFLAGAGTTRPRPRAGGTR